MIFALLRCDGKSEGIAAAAAIPIPLSFTATSAGVLAILKLRDHSARPLSIRPLFTLSLSTTDFKFYAI